MIILQLDGDQLHETIENALRKVLAERAKSVENTLNRKEQKEILSIEEVCELLNLAKPTIYGLTSRRELPFFKTGKKLYFKRSELLLWIENGKQKTIQETTDDTFRDLQKSKR